MNLPRIRVALSHRIFKIYVSKSTVIFENLSIEFTDKLCFVPLSLTH